MKAYYEYDDDLGRVRYAVHDCPFCGSRDTDLYWTQVRCDRCGAQGPDVDEEHWWLAITLWNELPRKGGDELKALRLHWSNLMRRVKRAEKKANAGRDGLRRKEETEEAARKREDARGVRERSEWLGRPVIE